MGKYFDKFPIISYKGNPVRNILARTKLSDATKEDRLNFVTQKLQDSLRADLISERYYENPYYDWMIYYSNDVTDPYYDMVLSEENLVAFIQKKYGSLSRARDLILFYRNNWYSTDATATITTSAYEALPLSYKKYYTADINYYNNVVGYKRKPIDWTLSTNKLRTLTVDITDYSIIGDIYVQYDSLGDLVAQAQLVSFNAETSTMTFKNIIGEFVNTTGNYLVSKYVNTEYQYFVSAVNNPSTSDNIPDSELVFWESVSAYDYETEKNEELRNIQILRRSQKLKLEQQFNEILRS